MQDDNMATALGRNSVWLICSVLNNAGRIALLLVAFVLLRFFAKIVYNLLFHPLRHFPGPWTAAASPIPFCWRILNGCTVPWNRGLHAKYGPVVRVAPDELNFITSSAWREIYNTRPELPKPAFGAVEVPNGVRAIATWPDPENHARQKKIVGHAFSPSALKAQESIIQKYSDRLVEELSKLEGEIDMHQWFNFASFDMMGELSFGESFNCLENAENHPWVTAVFDGVKIATMMTVLQYLWPLLPIIKACLPPPIRRKVMASYNFTKEAIDRRIASKSERPDFLRYMLENNHPKGMTRPEIDATSTFLVLAGSDTTAQTLTGVIYFALTTPGVMTRLQKEVDNAFGGLTNDDKVTSTSASQLPFMHAVLLETLRLHSPGAVSIPRHVDRPGVVVGGWEIPAGYRIGVPGKPMHTSSTHFTSPNSFHPERWLLEGDLEFAKDNKGAFEPFLVGPRSCLGKQLAWAEMNSTMAKIIFNFDFELSERMMGVDWSDTRVYLIHETKPLWVKFRHRKKA